MNNLFLGFSLGNDPHTLGIFNAAKIAKRTGLDFKVLPADSTDEEKLRMIKDLNPRFLGMSYRLSPDKAVQELKKFLKLMEVNGLLENTSERQLCFAGLLPTLREVHNLGLDKKYNISLMGSYTNLSETTQKTAKYFGVAEGSIEMDDIIESIRKDNEPERIDILDEIAKEVIKNDVFLMEPPLKKPSDKALEYFPQRMKESSIPVIRSHFGIPDSTIYPTVDGITKIANAGAVDEISIGSSDLSQRYYGDVQKFRELKNDGGVPYKNFKDLIALSFAAKTGNFPALKPYCHVRNINGFIDECLRAGMLKGAHQAIPLFWFNELDGRGDMTLEESIDAHVEGVKYLAQKGIPVEINDPNQWSSRFVHDTLFVVSYALLSSVMYAVGVRDMVIQCQFNKPATTGDYADLGKFLASKRIIEELRPRGNRARVYYEARSGIEHFSTDLNKAKFQLPRSVLLQMLINPSILHLVSYCEADHVATAYDVIESSKILRHAVKAYKMNECDIKKQIRWNVVETRAEFLFKEAMVVLSELVALDGKHDIEVKDYYRILSKPSVLKKAMLYRYMTAPCIPGKRFSNPDILTKVSEYGYLDCYENWEDEKPMPEMKRIEKLKKLYGI